jgi:hypothetical protein
MIIHLYKEPSAKTLNIDEIASYLKENLNPPFNSPFNKEEYKEDFIQIHDEFFKSILSNTPSQKTDDLINKIAEKLANVRVRNPNKSDYFPKPIYGEIEYEKKLLENIDNKPIGVIYDGFRLSHISNELIPENQKNYRNIHIIFTNQLLGTFDRGDKRYHLRVNILGYPSIISTSGVVEAPAKPKEYYIVKKQLGNGSEDLLSVWKKNNQHRFIDYDDERLTEIMKVYVLQSLFFFITGEPFCDNKNCRLFNAHWQEEMIHSQIVSGKVCNSHYNQLTI